MSEAPSKKSKMVYTIGYATKPINQFIRQLKHYGVTALADVRSVPYSKVFVDYHQPALKTRLINEGIKYVYLGEELGPRSKDESHYDQCGQVQFSRLMTSDYFLNGVARLNQGVLKGYRIALMCAEKDPLDCHRSLLISHYLRRYSEIEIAHILHDGTIVNQLDLESQLQKRFISDVGDLFGNANDDYEMAWQQQCKLKAYRLPSPVVDKS